MTLEQLKMLKFVAEFGSLKAASEQLYKTQPAISQGIKQLEQQLDVLLFNRTGYRLTLTTEGEQIYQQALKLLGNASELKQLSQHLAQGNEAVVTLAIEAAYDFNRIIPILEKTQKEFPNTAIILKQEYLTGTIEVLEQGLADIAISPLDALTRQSQTFDSSWVYQGCLVNVASPTLLMRHPKLSKVEELSNEYQIVVQDSGSGTKGQNFSIQSGQRCWYANDFSTKKTLILSGMGWGRLPEHKIEKELVDGSLLRLIMDDLENEIPLQYHAIKSKNKILGPVASKLWQSLLATEN